MSAAIPVLPTPVTVTNGGTGDVTLTNHGVLLGQGTTAVAVTTAGTAGQVLTSNGASADPTFQAASGAVSSVSNSDGTLTISPTTGAVVASLALGHANTWTATQTFTASPVAPFGSGTGTLRYGDSAGNNTATGSYNTAFGFQCMAALTSGAQNTGVGYQALLSLTTGTNNFALGLQTLMAVTSGSQNTGIGTACLFHCTGSNNVAIGDQVLFTGTAMNSNTGIGTNVLHLCTGGFNVGIGAASMQTLVGGSNNNAIGYASLLALTSGNNNTGVGDQCGLSVLSTGSGNVLLGALTDTAAAGTSNGVAIGYQAVCADNEAAFGPNINFFSFFGQGSYGGGSGVVFLKDRATAPTTNPAGGGILFSTAGALHWRGSSGTDTTIAPAEPYCPTCGKDFVSEWKNEKMGHLLLCMWCLTEGMTKGVVKREAA